MVQGGGGGQWRKDKENRKLQQWRLSKKKKIIAAMKAVKENDYSNEGCQGKWLQQWRLKKKLRKQSLLDQELWYQVESNRWNIFFNILQMWLQSLFIDCFTT